MSGAAPWHPNQGCITELLYHTFRCIRFYATPLFDISIEFAVIFIMTIKCHCSAAASAAASAATLYPKLVSNCAPVLPSSHEVILPSEVCSLLMLLAVVTGYFVSMDPMLLEPVACHMLSLPSCVAALCLLISIDRIVYHKLLLRHNNR